MPRSAHLDLFVRSGKVFGFAGLVIGISLSAVTIGVAKHTEDTRDLTSDATTSTHYFVAPFVVRWLAINPLRYPTWHVYDSINSKSGPTLSTYTGVSPALQSIESGAATPIPTSTDASIAALIPQVYDPVDPDSVGDDNCGVSKLSGPPAVPTTDDIKTLNACFESVRSSVLDPTSGIVAKIDSSTALLRRVTIWHQRLANVIDIMLTNSRFSTESATGQSPARLPGSDSLDAALQQLDQNLVAVVISGPGSAIKPEFRAVIDSALQFSPAAKEPNAFLNAAQLQDKIAALQPWPSKQIDDTLASITALQQYLKLRDLSTVKSTADYTSAPADACVLIVPSEAKVPAGHKAPAKTPSKPSLTASGQQRCLNMLSEYQSQLKARAAASEPEKNYSAALSRMESVSTQVLGSLTPARFHYVNYESCRGTNTSRRDHVFSLVLDNNHVLTDIAVCESRLVTSGGVAFSFLPQQTYSTVPYNKYAGRQPPATAPSPIPQGAGFIEPTQNQAIRAFPVQLLNYKISDFSLHNDAPESELFSTFGVGLSQSVSGTSVDFIAGGSVAFTRAAFLTFGVHLGSENFLSPGYKTGDFSVAAPQTTTRYTPGFTIVASYGGA